MFNIIIDICGFMYVISIFEYLFSVGSLFLFLYFPIPALFWSFELFKNSFSFISYVFDYVSFVTFKIIILEIIIHIYFL